MQNTLIKTISALQTISNLSNCKTSLNAAYFLTLAITQKAVQFNNSKQLTSYAQQVNKCTAAQAAAQVNKATALFNSLTTKTVAHANSTTNAQQQLTFANAINTVCLA